MKIICNYKLVFVDLPPISGLKRRLQKLFCNVFTVLCNDCNGLSGNGLIELIFVTDRQIRVINKKYRNLDRTTDVISLSYIDNSPFPLESDDLAGEIFISLDTSKRQAENRNISLSSEIQFLFVHGMLHVLGYDHLTPKEREVMFALQTKILSL